jgi:hypothetical protein
VARWRGRDCEAARNDDLPLSFPTAFCRPKYTISEHLFQEEFLGLSPVVRGELKSGPSCFSVKCRRWRSTGLAFQAIAVILQTQALIADGGRQDEHCA